MYIIDSTTLELYNNTDSGFSEIIRYFPAINEQYLKNYGSLQEMNYVYTHPHTQNKTNIFPLRNTVISTEVIILGLYEVRRQLHQNIKVSWLYNGSDINPSGLLYYLVNNWGPRGENYLNSECLTALYKLMKFIQKQMSIVEDMLKLVGELNIPPEDLDKLIMNISKINLSSNSVDDLTKTLTKINLSAKTIDDITDHFTKMKT